MADIGFIRGQLGGIQDEPTRRVLLSIFEYIVNNITVGQVDHQARAKNFQAYFETSTSASTASQEWSFSHGMGVTPHLAIPVLDLRSAGSQLIPLTVSRVADSQRVYLKSTSTSAPFALLIE